jgi:predicted ribosomally synthesized peptide with SipW-like signal peptide
MSTSRKILTSLLIVGLVSSVIGAGTFATFSAQVSNANNTFATGTLVLSNKVNAGTACLSTGGGTTDTNSNTACDQLFNLTARKPGQNGSAQLTIQNKGTIGAMSLKLFANSACAAADAAGETYHGTGDPCTKVDLTIQQTQSDFTTPVSCVYGGGTATACAFDTTKTLSTFRTAYNSTANGIDLGALAATGVTGDTKYFVVAVQLDSAADNTMQGRKAAADFTWYAVQ